MAVEWKQQLAKAHVKAKANKPEFSATGRKPIVTPISPTASGTSTRSPFQVNPDPRPPNEVQPSTEGQNNQSKQPGAIGSSERTPAPAPAAPISTAPNPSTDAPDPRDDTYYRNMLRLQATHDSAISQTNLEETLGNTAYEESNAELNRAEPLAKLNERVSGNNGGALYSSATAENVGQVGINYFNQHQGLTRNKDHEDAMRKIISEGLNSGLTADQAAEYASATDRAAKAEMYKAPPPDAGPTKKDDPTPDDDPMSVLKDYLKGLGKGKGTSNKGNDNNDTKGGDKGKGDKPKNGKGNGKSQKNNSPKNTDPHKAIAQFVSANAKANNKKDEPKKRAGKK